MSLKKIILPVLTSILFTSVCLAQQAQKDKEIDTKSSLIERMILEEKVGQLILFTSDLTTTGPTIRDDYKKLIKEGKTGAVFNAYGAEYTKELQDLAVNNTQLGPPALWL